MVPAIIFTHRCKHPHAHVHTRIRAYLSRRTCAGSATLLATDTLNLSKVLTRSVPSVPAPRPYVERSNMIVWCSLPILVKDSNLVISVYMCVC